MEITALPFEDLKKEKARIAALHSHNILDTEGEDEYDRIVKVASYICGTPISLISLVDTDRQWFKSRVGLSINETSRDMSFCTHAIKEEGIMEINDASEDERFKDNPMVKGEPNIRFYAGTPLVTSDGYKLGTLCVIDRVPRTLTVEQKECLENLSRQVMDQMILRQQKRKLIELNSTLIKDLETKLEQQEKVLQLFVRFVPEAIVAKHLHSKDDNSFNDAEAKQMAIMFCDIRGYTSIVENLNPKQAVSILRSYYSILSDVISTYSGMVNQYVGDEIFASFGSPFTPENCEKHAVLCALEMLNQLKTLNEECSALTPVPIKIGIGIHTGEVITGTLGSKSKIEYCITGDAVNTGKRIETLTQDHPNTILISETVYEKVKDIVEVELWPAVTLKGKTNELKIYQVLGKK